VCRSALWEITAVPDIHQHCAHVAGHIVSMVRQSVTNRMPMYPVISAPAALGKIPALWF